MILKYISRAYRNFIIDEKDLDDTVTVWHDILQDVSGEEAQRVTRLLCRTHTQFAPTPAEIYQAVLDQRPSPSVYEVQQLEERQAVLELKEYHEREKAVPMPDHIREQLNATLKKVTVTTDEP